MEDGRPIYDKALREYREITQTWHPQAQIWALTHGTRIGTFCVAGSSFAILIRMRQFFNLFSQQHLIGTILPCVILPSVGYYVSQDLFINRKIFYGFNSSENRKSFCSTCLETRGSVIQVFAVPFIRFLSSKIKTIVFCFLGCCKCSCAYRIFVLFLCCCFAVIPNIPRSWDR